MSLLTNFSSLSREGIGYKEIVHTNLSNRLFCNYHDYRLDKRHSKLLSSIVTDAQHRLHYKFVGATVPIIMRFRIIFYHEKITSINCAIHRYYTVIFSGTEIFLIREMFSVQNEKMV